jgi:hypothetical protein
MLVRLFERTLQSRHVNSLTLVLGVSALAITKRARATITLSLSSIRAEETTYPLKSENAIPPGDFSEYLSCA